VGWQRGPIRANEEKGYLRAFITVVGNRVARCRRMSQPMDDGRMPRSLNAAQRTAVVIALSGLERDLRQAEMWLRGQPQGGMLYRTSLRLSPARREAVLSEIAKALEVIAQLAERLDLQPTEEPLTNRIAAAMTIDWANLTDTASAKLKRYGPVDPGLRDTLDPEIACLARLALSISSLIEETDGTEVPDEREGIDHSLDAG